MKPFIALAATALASTAFAQAPLVSQPSDARIYRNATIPHQEEGSEGWLSNQEQAAAIGQGRPSVHDGVVYNPVYVAPSMTVDDRLVSDVSAALANDPGLRGAYLNVDSLNGEVRVSGTVADYDQAALVRRVAEGVAGPGRVMTSLAPR
jgi:osmotically-inducible protein OsmY